MNKLGMVLGIAAVATLAGCKDPDYNYGDGEAAQNEVKSAEAQPAPETQAKADQPITIEAAPAPKCTCLPGTKHTSPCTCGAPDCKCIVEAPVVIKADASAPAAAAAGAAAAEYTTYVVQKGDVLSKIAKKYNLKVSDIRNANPKIKKDVIWVGMKLKLPGKIDVGQQAAPAAATKSAAAAPKAATPYTGATKEYVVKSGDTLGGIAIASGITVRQLKEMNGMTKDMIRVGQKIKVPAQKVVAAKKAAPAAKKTAKAAPAKVAPAKAAAPAPGAAPAPAPAVAPAAEPAPAPAPAAAPAAEPAPAAAPAAEPTPAAAPAAAAPAPAATYVVQEGDDMTGVCIRWGVSAAAIRELNNLPDDAQLTPGQILKLPADAQQ